MVQMVVETKMKPNSVAGILCVNGQIENHHFRESVDNDPSRVIL